MSEDDHDIGAAGAASTMQSPGLELDGALGALAHAYMHADDETKRKGYLAGYVTLLMEYLTEQGVSPAALAPLRTLRDVQLPAGRAQDSRRRSEMPSDAVLARVCAVIDLLIKAGYSDEQAAQRMMRQLLASGLAMPSYGGDARGWKRLLLWRAKLQAGLVPQGAEAEYHRLREEIDAIPAAERVDRVLRLRLWDRREASPGA